LNLSPHHIDLNKLTINSQRVWDSLMALAAIGATEKGGVCRLALTELDRQARDLFIRWAREAGCSIRVDAIGNIFAKRPGRDPARGSVATGSHIDTQPTGGKFDGNYGVLAGLEVIRTLNDHRLDTEAAIEICVWTNEEGSRFVPVMMGSGVYGGAFSLDHALSAVDRDGITVKEALHNIGFSKSALSSTTTHAAPIQHQIPAKTQDPIQWAEADLPFEAYFEAHIEQGPVLEDAGITIGAVTGALGQRWYDVLVTGQEAHAGPTPMPLRRDALQAALKLMAEVEAIAMKEQPHARGTVGYVDVFPNSRNVIPGRVSFSVDFRHTDTQGLERMDVAIRQACSSLMAGGRVTVNIEQVVYFAPTAFAENLVQAVRDAASSQGFQALDIVSGAGHDAVHVAKVAPSAMIFIPCKDGISHNEIEDAHPDHIGAGANVLLQAMLKLAGLQKA
jgi:beta-ureidopropionase / N-carbamoyl-L-amino-acid hydrolase